MVFNFGVKCVKKILIRRLSVKNLNVSNGRIEFGRKKSENGDL